jgi:hypothetical protein
MNSKLFEPETEGTRMDLQDRGGSGGPFDLPTGFMQNLQDMLALRGGQIL